MNKDITALSLLLLGGILIPIGVYLAFDSIGGALISAGFLILGLGLVLAVSTPENDTNDNTTA